MTPPGATCEAEIAGGMALWDVSDLLPTGERSYARRDPRDIERVYVHHSGADGPQGYRGALTSARYMVQRREWPGAGYHFWLPTEPDRDSERRIVVYRMQHDSVRSYHTKGLNDRGIGVCLQGDLTELGMTDAQEELLEGLLPWLRERYRLLRDADWLSMHSEADRWGGRSKPSCPGPVVAAWVRAYRVRAMA